MNAKMQRIKGWVAGLLLIGCGAALAAADTVEIGGAGLTTAQARQAAEALKDGQTLSVRKGVYHFDATGAKRVFLAPSNNDAGEKDIVFPLFDKHDVTVDGNGSTFIFHGSAFPFAALKGENVHVKNLTVRSAVSPCFPISVKEHRADGVLFAVGAGAAAWSVKDGELSIVYDGSVVSSKERAIRIHALDRFEVRFLLTRAYEKSYDKDKTQAPFSLVTFEKTGENEIFARYLKDDHKSCEKVPYAAGRPLCVNLATRERVAFFFEDCERAGIENVRVESWAGMGFVAQRSKDLSVRRYQVLPAKGDLATTSADMMQFIACCGQVLVENCEGQDSMDDVIDIHGNYLRLEHFDFTNFYLRAMHPDHAGFFPVRPNDRLAFLRPSKGRAPWKNDIWVESVRPDPSDPMHVAIVKFKNIVGQRATPIKGEEVLVENVTLYPNVIFRNNTFRHYPCLRFSGRGDYLIENNHLENAQSAMLLLDHPHYWYECGPINNMTIRNNTFIGCNDQGGSAFVTIGTFGCGSPSPKVHGRILLENNRYERVKDRKVIAWGIVDLVDRDSDREAAASTYYLSPTGDDETGDGTSAKPLKTLARAAALSREQQKLPARFVFKDGVYSVGDKAVGFDAKDSGVVIEAEHPGKAILSGAVPVTNWKTDDSDPRFLVAELPFACKTGMNYIFTVGDTCADIACYPDFGGKNKMAYLASEEESRSGNRTVMKYDRLGLPKGKTFADLDLLSAWVTVPQEWATSTSYILTNDWKNDTFVLKSPVNMPIGHFNTGFQIVNCRLGMRHPGMWMLEVSKNRLVYWPKEGETVETLAKNAAISRATQVFSFSRCRDVIVRGLVIESLASSFRMDSAIMTWGGHGLGARLNMLFENLEIRNCAGNGLRIYLCGDNIVRNCHVHHMGGTGIAVEGSAQGNRVLNNHVHDIGLFCTSGTGVRAQSSHSEYVGNHIHHVSGNGFVLWSSHSLFASNHIHHVMSGMRDGGGLYGGYTFSTLKDNWTHDTGDWPGLYNDEGGQQCVFTGNRFDGSWWPFHMHDCYGIIVTNNTFTCDDAMRFSFGGSTECVFSNNLIRTRKMVTRDSYLDNCAVWADNRVELKQDDGTYKFAGKVTLKKPILPPKPPFVSLPSMGRCIDYNNISNELFRGYLTRIDRDSDGRFGFGVPGAYALSSYDTTNVYFRGTYEYNKLCGYPGSKRIGHVWGKHDGLKLHFKGFSLAMFLDGTVIASDPAHALTVSNYVGEIYRGIGDGLGAWGVMVPLKWLGIEGSPLGKTVPFNIEFYNGDHDVTRWWTQPINGNVLSGTLSFNSIPPPVRRPASDTTIAVGEDGDIYAGAMAPFGKVQVDLETAYRPRETYEEATGYHPRNLFLHGFTFRDRSDVNRAGHRAFLVMPYTEADEPSDKRQVQRMEQASMRATLGNFHVMVQRWDLAMKTFATENAAYCRFNYERGGKVKLLVDGGYADRGGKVEKTDYEIQDGDDGVTILAHSRVKTGWFGKGYDVWAKFAVNHKPQEIRRVRCGEGPAERLVLEFDLMPQYDDIIVKAGVSEQSAAEAAARFDADKDGFARGGDLGPQISWEPAASKGVAKVWEDILAPCTSTAGHANDRRIYHMAVATAYLTPGTGTKTYRVRTDIDHSLKVTAKGVKDASSRLKSFKVNGEALPANFPKGFFKPTDELELEFE